MSDSGRVRHELQQQAGCTQFLKLKVWFWLSHSNVFSRKIAVQHNAFPACLWQGKDQFGKAEKSTIGSTPIISLTAAKRFLICILPLEYYQTVTSWLSLTCQYINSSHQLLPQKKHKNKLEHLYKQEVEEIQKDLLV